MPSYQKADEQEPATPVFCDEIWQSPCGRATMIRGDSLMVLPQLKPESFAAVITDPPYSSGGAFRSDRVQKTVDKYVNTDSGQRENRSEFSGDSRDQRGFLAWASLWLGASRRLCTPGAVLCSFIDWRQLPVLVDAVQSGGWVWRNLCTWHKPGCRMQKGRFSASAEYVVYATNGPHDATAAEKAAHNVFACQPVAGEDKEHIAEKPELVLEWITSVTEPDCAILDPFAGSGTGGICAIRMKRRWLGIEIDKANFDTCVRRLKDELARDEFLEPTKAKAKAKQAALFDDGCLLCGARPCACQ